MPEPRRYAHEAWVPVVAGAAWFFATGDASLWFRLLAAVPGALLLGGGVAGLAFAGDRRIQHFTALGGVLGLLLALPALFAAGLGTAIVLALLTGAAFVAAGWQTVHDEDAFAGAPPQDLTPGLAAQVALDDALLAWMGALSLTVPSAAEIRRIQSECEEVAARFRERGLLEKPADWHERPPDLEAADLEIRSARAAGIDHEQLRFESGYEPEAGMPGRERWLEQRANRTAHAWVMRHPGPERPWLVCLHGYQMGAPAMDLPAFRAKQLHHERGLNLAFPVAALHGPRKPGRVSGQDVIGADFVHSLYAETQTMWDLRRVIDWIRRQGAPAIGVTGLSMGGYNTALLAGLEADLACAIAGIPATDFVRLVWRHGPPGMLRYAEAQGITPQTAADVMRVVSPLAVEPLVPLEHRAIYGGTADQLVPPEQVSDLWEHWGRPPIAWYPGAHISFGLHAGVGRLVDETLRDAGLVALA